MKLSSIAAFVLTLPFALGDEGPTVVWQREAADLSDGRTLTPVTELWENGDELYLFMGAGPAAIHVVDAATGIEKRNHTLTPPEDSTDGRNYGITQASVYQQADGSVDHIIVLVSDDNENVNNGFGRLMRINDDGGTFDEAWSVSADFTFRIPVTGELVHSADGGIVYTNTLFGDVAAFDTTNGNNLWINDPMQGEIAVRVGGITLVGDKLYGAKSGLGDGSLPQLFEFSALSGQTTDTWIYSACLPSTVCEGYSPASPRADPAEEFLVLFDQHAGILKFDLTKPISDGPVYYTDSLDYAPVTPAISSDSETVYGGYAGEGYSAFEAEDGSRTWEEASECSENVEVLLGADYVYFVNYACIVGRPLQELDNPAFFVDYIFNGISGATLSADQTVLYVSYWEEDGVIAYETNYVPSLSPTGVPTAAPTAAPSAAPSAAPTGNVTIAPTDGTARTSLASVSLVAGLLALWILG